MDAAAPAAAGFFSSSVSSHSMTARSLTARCGGWKSSRSVCHGYIYIFFRTIYNTEIYRRDRKSLGRRDGPAASAFHIYCLFDGLIQQGPSYLFLFYSVWCTAQQRRRDDLALNNSIFAASLSFVVAFHFPPLFRLFPISEKNCYYVRFRRAYFPYFLFLFAIRRTINVIVVENDSAVFAPLCAPYKQTLGYDISGELRKSSRFIVFKKPLLFFFTIRLRFYKQPCFATKFHRFHLNSREFG